MKPEQVTKIIMSGEQENWRESAFWSKNSEVQRYCKEEKEREKVRGFSEPAVFLF